VTANTQTRDLTKLCPILVGIAEFERSLIIERTSAGRARAAGVRFGRKLKLTEHQRAEAFIK
jgi:DNA invertase Pin-like site-specific DNA recombinase